MCFVVHVFMLGFALFHLPMLTCFHYGCAFVQVVVICHLPMSGVQCSTLFMLYLPMLSSSVSRECPVSGVSFIARNLTEVRCGAKTTKKHVPYVDANPSNSESRLLAASNCTEHSLVCAVASPYCQSAPDTRKPRTNSANVESSPLVSK